MAKLRFKISMSLDAFVAGSDQRRTTARNRRRRLHEWAF